MGFHITGDIKDGGLIYDKTNELRQRINLSIQSWNIIDEDIRNFYSDETKESFSGFLNTIFSNFYQEADATISQRYINRSEELNRLFSSDEFKLISTKTTELYISKMLDVFERQLIEKVLSYPKGEGRKFRINKKTLNILRDSSEFIYYDDSIGNYLRAIFEEYCSLPNYVREQVFFKDTIETIDLSISQSKKLKITILPKITVNQDHIYIRQFYVTPYKLVQDRTNSFNYLIGYAEEILPNGKISMKQITSFRVSRINRVSVMASMNAFLPKPKYKEIEKLIIQKDPQYMVGDIIDIKIKFSQKGLESFKRQIYMRPKYFDKLDSNTYLFKCSEVHAMNYFFKFGREVQIIEPIELRNKFIKRYEDALNKYKE